MVEAASEAPPPPPAAAAEKGAAKQPREARVSALPKPGNALLEEAQRETEAAERYTTRLAQIDALIKQRNAARKAGSGNAEQAATKVKLDAAKALCDKSKVRVG
jgi:hypothetical protein